MEINVCIIRDPLNHLYFSEVCYCIFIFFIHLNWDHNSVVPLGVGAMGAETLALETAVLTNADHH